LARASPDNARTSPFDDGQPRGTPTSTPVPGRFYRIQPGAGGLLATAARAYGVPLSPDPIRLARDINEHPYNRRFLREPRTAWERRQFPAGLISSSPRFAADLRQQFATPSGQRAPRGSAFAAIFIPPRTAFVHPILGPGAAVPQELLAADQPAPEGQLAQPPNPIQRGNYATLAHWANLQLCAAQANQSGIGPDLRYRPHSMTAPRTDGSPR